MTDEKKDEKKPEPGPVAQVVGGIIVLGLAWFGYNWFVNNQVQTDMANINNQVASDAVQQYDIAKQQGDVLQTCVQAGMVSAAWLQAKNQAEYNKWKEVEKQDCAKAGMPK